MERGFLTMNQKERKKLEILSKVKDGNLTLKEASNALGISYRQIRRIFKRYNSEGDSSIIHKSRGKVSNRSKAPELKKIIIEKYREKYKGFGPTLASEKLQEDGLMVDHCTLWRWLKESNDWNKSIKLKKIRNRRKRSPHFGELVQMDGSEHDWFEKRGKRATLMNMIDDATGITLCFLCEGESTENAMKVLWEWIEKYGIPLSIYVDRHAVYFNSPENDLTQFGLACRELGINIIYAHSPQAKGRIERSNGIYQDRLVKELRLQNISDISDANKFLKDYFIDNLNKKFSCLPENNLDLHCKNFKEINLSKIFCFRYKRVISNDWTVRYKNKIFQIIDQDNLPKTNKTIEVREYLDNTIDFFHKGNKLVFKVIKGNNIENQRHTIKKSKKENYNEILKLIHKGYTKTAIASEVGINRETVSKYLLEGIPVYNRKNISSKLEPYKDIIEKYLSENYSIRKIYLLLKKTGFNVSEPTLRNFIRKNNLRNVIKIT
jgi:transposase/predicted transcriptional regulator